MEHMGLCVQFGLLFSKSHGKESKGLSSTSGDAMMANSRSEMREQTNSNSFKFTISEPTK